MNKAAGAFEKLVEIVAKLRDPKCGCPWDLEQTHSSLKPCLIEETYELVDAIDHQPEKMREELGDVLMQVVLHSRIAAEAGDFSLEDVISDISAKLVRRHPHVFAGVAVKGTGEVLVNWEKIKSTEKKAGNGRLDGIPRSMPALAKAQRIGDRSGRVGFDWPGPDEVREKVREELQEFLESSADPGGGALVQEEFGDLLFALVQLARKLNFDAEDILNSACEKFMRRFRQLEEQAGSRLAGMTLDQMREIWEQIKVEEKRAR